MRPLNWLKTTLFNGIQGNILLLATVPVISITFILTLYQLQIRESDLNNSLNTYGQSTVEYLASAAELAMYADDIESLQQISKGPLKSTSVKAILYIKNDYQALYKVGELQEVAMQKINAAATPWQNNIWQSSELRFFRAEVSLDSQSMSDFGDFEEDLDGKNYPENLGWVVVVLSLAEMREKQLANILVAILIAGVITVLVSVIAIWFSRRIYKPITDLTDAVHVMETGDLNVTAATDSGDKEIQLLARVINRLASSLLTTNKNLQTDIEHATQALRQALTGLEKRNYELTETQEELEQALSTKDQFLARMSHELRSPLTTVIGFTRLLNRSELDSEQREYSHNIAHASALLLSVIDDLLDFSKIQYGAVTLEIMPFNLESEIEDLVALHAYNAYSKSIELVLLIDSDVPTQLLGDPTRLRQIINNLLSNAIKFTDSGEVIVRFSKHHTDLDEDADVDVYENPDRVKLDVSIKDSGIGMDEQSIEKLFQPFTQADTSISRRFGGSGLGLVICKQLIELMGGDIVVESTVNKGTEFRFVLDFELQPKTNEAGFSNLPDKQHTVAIMDDNPWSRMALRSQASKWTRQVYAVGDLQQLVPLLQNSEDSFSVLLIGMSPGKMQTKRLAETFAAIRDHYQGPIILLACLSNISAQIPEHLLQRHAPIWCLSKPARRESLLEWLDVATDGGNGENGGNDAKAQGDDEDNKPTTFVEAPSTTSPIPQADGDLHNLQVLIAEDNQFNQSLIETILAAEGASVILASDGQQAIDQYKAHQCDLIIMDIHMPVVNGLDATKTIQEEAIQCDHPVQIIALTANVLENEELQLQQLGVNHILKKPIDEELLLKTLCQCAGRKYNARVSRASTSTVSKAQFRRELLLQTAKLRRALTSGQLLDSRETLHQLLGLAGLFGTQRLRSKLLKLRDITLNAGATSAHTALNELEEYIDQEID